MSSKSKMDTGWGSPDTRIYYAKKYRQVLSSAPSAALAVVAGVSEVSRCRPTQPLTSSRLHLKISKFACNRMLDAEGESGGSLTMNRHYFPNAWQATRYTYRTEGLRGFWAGRRTRLEATFDSTLTRAYLGTLPPLFSITFSRALGFSIYRKAKYAIDSWIEKTTGSSPLQHVNKPGTYPTIYTLACFTGAGMISGGVTAVVLSTSLVWSSNVRDPAL